MMSDFLNVKGVILRAELPFMRNGKKHVVASSSLTDEVAKSFTGLPITNEHPAIDLHVTPENYAKTTKGSVRNAWVEDNALYGEFLVGDQELAQDIESGKIKLSAAYTYTPVPRDDGMIVETDIEGNHVAVVDAPRQAGTELYKEDTIRYTAYNSIDLDFAKKKGKNNMDEMKQEEQTQDQSSTPDMAEALKGLDEKISALTDMMMKLVEMLQPADSDEEDAVNEDEKKDDYKKDEAINSLAKAVNSINEKLESIESKQQVINREYEVNKKALQGVKSLEPQKEIVADSEYYRNLFREGRQA